MNGEGSLFCLGCLSGYAGGSLDMEHVLDGRETGWLGFTACPTGSVPHDAYSAQMC